MTFCGLRFAVSHEERDAKVSIVVVSMEENTSGLKFARVIAVAHIIVGLFLFVLGLTERLQGDSWTGKIAFGIWCGLWVGFFFYFFCLNKGDRYPAAGNCFQKTR